MPGPCAGHLRSDAALQARQSRRAITFPCRLLQFTVPVECGLLPGNACAIASDTDIALHNARAGGPISQPIIHASDRP
jgi:hypothetical protein